MHTPWSLPSELFIGPSFPSSPPSATAATVAAAVAADFLGLALHLLAHFLRLLAHVPSSVRQPPPRMVRHLIRRADHLPYVVRHPRERRHSRQPECPRREEARYGEPNHQSGRHEHGAEDDEQGGRQDEPDEAPDEGDPGEAKEDAPGGEHRHDRKDLACGRAPVGQEDLAPGATVIAVLRMDLDLVGTVSVPLAVPLAVPHGQWLNEAV